MEVELVSDCFPNGPDYQHYIVVSKDYMCRFSSNKFLGSHFEVYIFAEKKLCEFSSFDFPYQYPDKLFLYTHEEEILIYAEFGYEVIFYTVVFDFHTLKTEFKPRHRMTRPAKGSMYRMASNLVAQPPSRTTQIWDLYSNTCFTLDLQTTSKSFASVPYAAAFMHNGRYVYIDDKFKLAVSINLSNKADIQHHSLTCVNECEFKAMERAHPPLQSFLLGDIVFMTDRKGAFLLDTRTWRIINITSKLNLKDICLWKITDDGEAVYIFAEPKVYKIQVRGLDLGEFNTDSPSMNETTADLLSCPICFENFDVPKMLQCGHTICFTCEKQITVNNLLTCPICRTVTELRTEQLPTNWIVKDALQTEGCFTPTKQGYMVCASCSTTHPQDQVFTCTNCSGTEQALMCGACALIKHSAHTSDVKQVHLVSVQSKRSEIDRVKSSVRGTLKQFDEESKNNQIYAQVIQKATEYRTEADKQIEKILKTTLTEEQLVLELYKLREMYSNLEKGVEAVDKARQILEDYVISS